MAFVEFATNDEREARKFLDQVTDVGDEVKEVLVQGVADGICRVRNPRMYGGHTAAIPETNDSNLWDGFMAKLAAAAMKDETKFREVQR